jgi:hypothetical protein
MSWSDKNEGVHDQYADTWDFRDYTLRKEVQNQQSQ